MVGVKNVDLDLDTLIQTVREEEDINAIIVVM